MPDGRTPEIPSPKTPELKLLGDVGGQPILHPEQIENVFKGKESPFKSPSEFIAALKSGDPGAMQEAVADQAKRIPLVEHTTPSGQRREKGDDQFEKAKETGRIGELEVIPDKTNPNIIQVKDSEGTVAKIKKDQEERFAMMADVGIVFPWDRQEQATPTPEPDPEPAVGSVATMERGRLVNPERYVRRSLERLSEEELKNMPELGKVFDGICQWYEDQDLDKRLDPNAKEQLNRNFQYFIEYTERVKEDPRFAKIEIDLINKGTEIIKRIGGRNVQQKIEDLQYGTFDEKRDLIIRTIEENSGRDMTPFQDLEEDRAAISSAVLGIDPTIGQTLAEKKITSRQAQLEFLRTEIRRSTEGTFAARDALVTRIDKLLGEYRTHLVMQELGEILEGRQTVIDEVKTKEKTENIQKVEALAAPNIPFEDARQLYENGNAAEQKYAKEVLKLYHKIAERIGLLDYERDTAHQDFLVLRYEIDKRVRDADGVVVTRGRVRDKYKRKLKTQETEDQAKDDWDLYGQDYVDQEKFKDTPALAVAGLTKDHMNGFLSYYRKNIDREMLDWLEDKHKGDKPLEGEWRIQDIEDRESEMERRARGGLWRIGPTGIYEIMIESLDVAQYRSAAESFVTNLVKAGVIDREPGALMQKAQYFAEALTAKAQEIADRDYLPEDKDGKAAFMKEIKDVRNGFNVEIYAYCGELFNHAFNVQNLAAIYSRMNNYIDGMDHWKVAMQLRDGQVYGAYLTQNDPEFEWMWRMMGPNGQLDAYYDVQLRAHGMMKDRLADKRVGEIIWDRHEEIIDGTPTGYVFVGEEARKKNLDLLGYDRPKKETLRAFVPKTEELLRMVGLSRGTLTKEMFEQKAGIFTPAEIKALTLRDIKARSAKEKGLRYEEKDILGFKAGLEVTKDEKDMCKDAHNEAKEGVDIFMQLISMTGDKARETGPSYVARATDAEGRLVPFLNQAVETDKIPQWRGQRLIQFAKSMAQRKIAEHNTETKKAIRQLEKEIAELKSRGKNDNDKDVKEKNDKLQKKKGLIILRGSKMYKAIMGDPTDKKNFDNNSVDGNPLAHGHGGDHGGGHGEHHGATGPWHGDVEHFKKEVGGAVWLTLDAFFKEGWSLKLKDFDINEEGEIEFSRQGRLMRIPGGENHDKEVNLYTAVNHPLAMHMTKTYLSSQPDQDDDIVKKDTRRKAQRYLDGKITADEAGILAMQLIAIDPALNRLVELPKDKKEQARYVLAAIEESALNHYDIRRALTRQFRGFIQWDYSSLMSTGTRRLMYMAEFAETHDKNTPRAEWMAPFVTSYVEPLGDSFGLGHSFEAIKLMKRKSLTEEQLKQEALDPPELDAAAQMYNIGMEMYSVWFGNDKGPGVFEKPTVSSENLTGDDFEPNEVRVMTKEEVRLAGLPPGSHVEVSKSIGHQLQLQKKMLDALGRIQPLFDKFYAAMSQNHGANGASDLRQTEIFEYDDNGEIVFRNGLPVLKWRLDSIVADGTRTGETIGRARHETAVVAKAFTTYAKSFQLKDEKGRIFGENGKDYIFNGAASEYGDAAFWMRHLNVYLKVHDLPDADRAALPDALQKKSYIKLEDFIISKWSRR